MIKLLFDTIVKGSMLHGLRMLVDTKRIWVHFFCRSGECLQEQCQGCDVENPRMRS